MKARYLGHVVFYVKDLGRSLASYRDLLGLRRSGESSTERRPRSRQVGPIMSCC